MTDSNRMIGHHWCGDLHQGLHLPELAMVQRLAPVHSLRGHTEPLLKHHPRNVPPTTAPTSRTKTVISM